MRVEQIGGATLYCGDSRELTPSIRGYQALVTSPPYGQARDYGRKIDDWRGLVSGILTESDPAAQVLVNLGLIHSAGEVVPYWDGLISDMREQAWRLFGWYVWDKCDGMGGDWQGRLAPAHEWIFHFNKVSRQPNKVYKSKLVGLVHKGNPGLRRADGSQTGYSHANRPVNEFKIPDSVVRVVPEKRGSDVTGGHPAVYPEMLPRVLVEAYTDEGETVFDPFLGSGTTGVAAVEAGRQFVGIELHEPYFDIACRRIEEAQRQGDMFLGAAA